MKKTRNLLVLNGSPNEVKSVLDSASFKALSILEPSQITAPNINYAFECNKSVLCQDFNLDSINTPKIPILVTSNKVGISPTHDCIDPSKDVDGFHPENVAKLFLGQRSLVPCTPKGMMVLLDEINYDLTGKEVVVVGRSNIVGKPVALLCLQKNATVTIAHSKTKNLKEVCQRADVLIAAVGRAKMINSDYVKEGAVVLDVGINRDENNKLCGDVDFEDVKDKVYAITPVPGGIGPMTITMLLQNTLEAFYHHQGE